MPADTTPTTGDDLPSGERLQKVMAAAGVASRRVSEDLIAAGRVTVNGKVVTEAGRRIDPDVDKVVVDGTAVQLDTTRRYVMLNKPVGVVSTLSDENGRPDLTQFTSDFEERLFNVGRLDVETSGLLLLTNDGELAHVLAHPSFGVTKTYIAKVRGVITPTVLAQLLSGVELDDGPIAADRASLVGGGAGLSRTNDSSLIEITLHSGRNRIVRRMLEAVGHPVIDLVRRSFGPLHLGTLKVGHMRSLNKTELGAILTISRDATAVPRVDAIPTTESADAPVDEADVVEVALDETEVEKEYYDEDDDEFDPDTDARDAKRRRGPSGFKGDAAAPASRRAEVRREQAGRREQRTGFDAPRGGARGGAGRDDRSASRPERGGYQGRDDRRDDRGAGRPERGGYQGRDDRRDDRGGAPSRGGYQGRDDRGGAPSRGGYQGRDDRRDDRGAGRPERGGYQGRDDRGGAPSRGGYQGRDDRGGAPSRGGYQGRDDRRDDRGAGRPERGGYQGRDDRRDDRGGYVSRDDRGGRPERGGYVSRDDRGSAPRGGDRPLTPGEERAAGYPNRDANKDPRTGRTSGVRAGGAARNGYPTRPRPEGGDDREQRGGYQGRDDRGGAPSRGGYQGRDDRRDDRGGAPSRGGYQGRDDRGGAPSRGGYQGRDDRGGAPSRGGYQGRDDRGGAPSRGGYQGRDDRGGAPSRGGYQGRDDRRDDRGGAPSRGGYQGRDDRGGRDDRRDERGGDRPWRPRPDDGGRGPRGGGRS
ncbi:pseudouridine synthase [Frigoribacterium sp. PhB160]|nr:pseudouridine synthase [Frigoribacterium sp. PhB160]